MDDQFIQLKKVTKIFGKNIVLDEIDLNIPEGKITGIIGASGEGKSTILKLISSFYKATSGEVLYFRRDVNSDIEGIKKSFGVAIESGSFYEDLTVHENLRHFGRLYKVNKEVLEKRIQGIIYFVGISYAKDVLAKNLSLGMKKRLDLACALVHKPSVLILDEPTADLDPLLRTQMLRLIKKINANGTTVIFTTQMLEEIDVLCDYVAILYNEKIIEDGRLESIFKKYGTKKMNTIFTKIFSKKGRKAYLESSDKKTAFSLKSHDESLKIEALDKTDFLQELKKTTKDDGSKKS
ncbi:ABC transporter ATP-binding protein [archaeon]|nr:ABC transporter ATP-binding protein [archaeon]